MIRTILFDLDNTLLDFHKAERLAIMKTLVYLGIEPNPEILSLYSQLNLAQWKLLESGKTTRRRLKVERFENLFAQLGIKCSADSAAKYYETQLSQGHYFMDGAETLLQELFKTKDLYLVTNGTALVQRSRLKSAGIEKFFKAVFISEEIGYNKPSAAFFERCFAQIPVFERQETVIVGDSLTSDIQGGINAGIKTAWFNPQFEENLSGIFPDYEINRLPQLMEIL